MRNPIPAVAADYPPPRAVAAEYPPPRAVAAEYPPPRAVIRGPTRRRRYDFDYQGYLDTSEFPISSDDNFFVECNYDKEHNLDTTGYFGTASNDEMCQTFIWYYPRSDASNMFNCHWYNCGDFEICDATFSATSDSLVRAFGTPRVGRAEFLPSGPGVAI